MQENKRYAVVDIGTNSMRLMVYEFTPAFHRIGKWVTVTRMGEDVDKTGVLSEAAMTRNLKALADFKEKAIAYGATQIRAFGTSAMRDAQNGEVFVMAARIKTGVPIQIISGEQEAAYGFAGVSHCFDGPVLICDIGGGSTEIISGEGDTITAANSLNMGCVRGTETFVTADPPTADMLAAIEKWADEKIAVVYDQYDVADDTTLVGIGGTATTLSTIHQALDTYDSDKVHLSRFTYDDLVAMKDKLSALPLEERKQVTGLSPDRADIILAGVMILIAIMKRFGKKEITICDHDNLEGAAVTIEREETQKEAQASDDAKA